jgi:ELWxxDGT repeat protein
VANVGFRPSPWRSDGTTDGTQPLTLAGGGDIGVPFGFTRMGDSVYFASSSNEFKYRLWRSTIANGETTLVRSLDDQRPTVIRNVDGILMFMLGTSLWRSDGTSLGTVKVRDGLPEGDPLRQTNYTVGDGLFYLYLFRNGAPELWRSDGTADGTFPLVMPQGPASNTLKSYLEQHLLFSNGRLYFPGNDFVHGAEPWSTDGTVAGTQILADINPGPASSDPGEMVTIGNTLYISATAATTGSELWAVPLGCGRDCHTPRRAVRH